MTTGSIYQINASQGGVPKIPVSEAVIGELGIESDAVAHPAIHGGPERAVSLFSYERITALAAEGHPISAGGTGENLTIEGIDWEHVVPGARLRLGSTVLLEITRYTTPCSTIRASFKDGDSNRIHQSLHPGWSRTYAKVLAGGTVRPGDPVELDGPGR